MKHPRPIATLIFLSLVLCTFAGHTQVTKKKRTAMADFGFTLEKHIHKSTSIPFKIYSNLIIVQAVIDNFPDTLNFILDTGVSSVFITDPTLASKMGLIYTRNVKISGAGVDSSLTANVSVNHTIKIGKVTGHKQNLVVLSEDVLELSSFLGLPIHGIFGHDFFSAFVLSIDWQSTQIEIFRPEKFKLKKKHGERFPVVITSSKPYTDAVSVITDDNIKIPLRLVIDTGAGHALLLNTDKANYPVPEKVIRANLGRGLNGEIQGNIGRIPKVEVGSVSIDNVLASFPDSISFSMKFPPTDINRQGSIGGEFLRRFKIIMNYHGGYMALKANKAMLKESFEHDMSGLDVRAKGTNFEKFIVDHVSPDSPADMVGLQPGDEIIFLNNRSSKYLNITDIYKTLSKKEGKDIEIFYKRDGKLDFAHFVLKRVI